MKRWTVCGGIFWLAYIHHNEERCGADDTFDASLHAAATHTCTLSRSNTFVMQLTGNPVHDASRR